MGVRDDAALVVGEVEVSDVVGFAAFEPSLPELPEEVPVVVDGGTVLRANIT